VKTTQKAIQRAGGLSRRACPGILFLAAGGLLAGAASYGQGSGKLPEVDSLTPGLTFQMSAAFSSEEEVFEIQNPGVVAFKPPLDGERYYAMVSINPALESDPERNPVINLSGAVLSFRLLRSPGVSNLEVLVYDREGEPDGAGLLYKLDPDDYFGGWVELMVRVDETAGIFDLYQRGNLRLADIPLQNDTDALSINSHSLRKTFLRELTISRDNPYFEDRDLDGIPDAFERLHAGSITTLGRYDTVEGSGEDLLGLYMNTFGKHE